MSASPLPWVSSLVVAESPSHQHKSLLTLDQRYGVEWNVSEDVTIELKTRELGAVQDNEGIDNLPCRKNNRCVRGWQADKSKYSADGTEYEIVARWLQPAAGGSEQILTLTSPPFSVTLAVPEAPTATSSPASASTAELNVGPSQTSESSSESTKISTETPSGASPTSSAVVSSDRPMISPPEGGSGSKLSAGATAGIVLGVLIAVVAIGYALYRHKRGRNQQDAVAVTQQSDTEAKADDKYIITEEFSVKSHEMAQERERSELPAPKYTP